jgi:Tfp pilus assembly protein PilX
MTTMRTMTPRTNASHSNTGRRRGEEGSALILAALVTVILSLLGLSYLMMAQTENTIAENERNSAAAMSVAEAGARMVAGWFNDPTTTGYLVPTTGDVDRTKRVFDNDNNTATARVLGVSGDATKPLYKDATYTASGILDRPYRSALADTFMGVETGTDPNPSYADKGPDLIVNASFLTTINNTMFPNYPAPWLRARITRIEVYGPPLISIGGTLTRMGVATIKVTSGVFMYPGTVSERQVATRVVKAVINEIPVPGPVGPIQSCSTLAYTGDFQIHWGTGSSIGAADLPSNLNSKTYSGMPYNVNDPYTYITGGTTLATWASTNDGAAIEDPWAKFISGGAINGAPNTNPQPWPWASATPLDQDHSNLFQNTVINCPQFDYALWKSIAQSGMKNMYYYKWLSADNFSLDGSGASTTFRAATNNATGVFFFDTKDGLAPDAGGTNLTPAISLSGGTWGVGGFMYLNAADFGTSGLGGVNRTVIPPGEPGDGTGFVNFQYPGSFGGSYTISNSTPHLQTFQDPVTGDWYCTDASVCTSSTRTQAGSPVKDNTGLPFTAAVAIDGVFFTSGTFDTQGNANYYGSVVAQRGVIDGAGTPGFYFDESLVKGNWPPKGMAMPRVVISSWQTNL